MNLIKTSNTTSCFHDAQTTLPFTVRVGKPYRYHVYCSKSLHRRALDQAEIEERFTFILFSIYYITSVFSVFVPLLVTPFVDTISQMS
jgi:hypothetical protein